MKLMSTLWRGTISQDFVSSSQPNPNWFSWPDPFIYHPLSLRRSLSPSLSFSYFSVWGFSPVFTCLLLFLNSRYIFVNYCPSVSKLRVFSNISLNVAIKTFDLCSWNIRFVQYFAWSSGSFNSFGEGRMDFVSKYQVMFCL